MTRKETLQDLLGDASLPEDTEAVTRIAVIGAGQMGRGIAHAVSAKGLEVLIIERDSKALSASMAKLEQRLDREIARWSMTEADKRAILSRISGTCDMMEIEGYRVVIEAVPDDHTIKTTLFLAWMLLQMRMPFLLPIHQR